MTASFECELSGEHRDTLIVNEQGEAIDPLCLHIKIQNAPAQQLALYRQAMTLWR